MDEIFLLDTAERYLKGELQASEKASFDQLRKDIPEVDNLVVEHSMFLHQIELYGDNKHFRHQLNEAHNALVYNGEIQEIPQQAGGAVIRLWTKYRRVTGIAASIAGLTALVISFLVSYLTPASNTHELKELRREVAQLKHNDRLQSNQIINIKSKVPVNVVAENGGTSFLIDSKGYMVTNAHVVKGASTILVQNVSGQEFKARIAYVDAQSDLAILKIDDSDFKTPAPLPYTIRRNSVDLGEPIFTLGYPKDEIVYNEGYMSAKTGYHGDTASCQIAVSANPGNSGGPVFNKNGDVIGILSSAQTKAEGVVFAIKSRNIYDIIDNLRKEDTTLPRLKTPLSSGSKSIDRVQQIKQIQDYVFMVRSFTK